MIKRYIHAASLGISIGLLLSLATSAYFGAGEYLPLNPTSTMGQWYLTHLDSVGVMGISVAIWAMIGLLFATAEGMFQQDWSLLKMTICHFLLVAVGFTGLGVLAGWFPLSISWIVFFEILFVFIYAIIFVFHYQSMKKKVDRINHYLKE